MVKTVKTDSLIVLVLNSKAWQKTRDDSYEVEITFKFERLTNNETMLTISEQGWKANEEGIKASHENLAGWKHMSMCLKAFNEYDIDLRK